MTAPSPGAWPLPRGPLVGRDRELRELVKLLARHPLVTIAGPAGCGKTRLAAALAALERDGLPRTRLFVALDAVRDPLLVDEAIAEALGAGRELPAGASSAADAFRDQAPLLILDNCEHVIAAAATAAAALLHAGGNGCILATSREPLGLRDEAVLRLAPLPVVAHKGQPSLAAELFQERANARSASLVATAHDRKAVDEICRRLDGLPLALELAAAWVPVLSPAEIAARLDNRFELLRDGPVDAPERHRALWTAIDWSYELLEEQDRRLFRLLSVFPASFDLAAAEVVADEERSLAGIRRLVERSLVTVDAAREPRRFALLESLREYGRERLQREGEWATANARLVDWALAVAARAEPRLTGPEQQSALEDLTLERPSLRAALAWTIEQHDGVTAVRLSGALWRYWLSLSHVREGLDWLSRAIAIGGNASLGDRARALGGAGVLARQRGDFARAAEILREHLDLRREQGDPAAIAQAMNSLAGALHASGQGLAAIDMLEEALTAWRDLGDERGEANTLSNLGIVASDAGDFAAARDYGERALGIRERIGHPESIAISLENLATAALRAGDLAAAGQLFQRTLRQYATLDEPDGIATAFDGLARVAASRGDHALGARLLGAARAIRRETGVVSLPADAALTAETAQLLRRTLGEGPFERALAEGEATEREATIAMALAPAGAPAVLLTPREEQVLALLATGASNKEMAAILGITVRTLERHLYNAYPKIGARGRADAVAWATRQPAKPPST